MQARALVQAWELGRLRLGFRHGIAQAPVAGVSPTTTLRFISTELSRLSRRTWRKYDLFPLVDLRRIFAFRLVAERESRWALYRDLNLFFSLPSPTP